MVPFKIRLLIGSHTGVDIYIIYQTHERKADEHVEKKSKLHPI